MSGPVTWCLTRTGERPLRGPDGRALRGPDGRLPVGRDGRSPVNRHGQVLTARLGAQALLLAALFLTLVGCCRYGTFDLDRLRTWQSPCDSGAVCGRPSCWRLLADDGSTEIGVQCHLDDCYASPVWQCPARTPLAECLAREPDWSACAKTHLAKDWEAPP
jgi:hypothetical protein